MTEAHDYRGQRTKGDIGTGRINRVFYSIERDRLDSTALFNLL